jgi:hypothetical protein
VKAPEERRKIRIKLARAPSAALSSGGMCPARLPRCLLHTHHTPHTTYPIPQLSHIKSLSIFGALLLSKQKPKTTLRIVRLLLHKRAVDAFLVAWATMLTGPPAPPARLLPGVP